MNQGLGVAGSPERFALMQGLLISPSLSFPESRGDMPFSFPIPGVITSTGKGSVGHSGLPHAKRREINVNIVKKTAPWQCQEALPLVLGNHQGLDGISSNNSILESRPAFYPHPGRMATERRTTNVSVKSELFSMFSWLSSHMGNQIP